MIRLYDGEGEAYTDVGNEFDQLIYSVLKPVVVLAIERHVSMRDLQSMITNCASQECGAALLRKVIAAHQARREQERKKHHV